MTTSPETIKFQLPNLPIHLHRLLKVTAAQKGVSMQDLIVEYIRKGLREEDTNQ